MPVAPEQIHYNTCICRKGCVFPRPDCLRPRIHATHLTDIKGICRSKIQRFRMFAYLGPEADQLAVDGHRVVGEVRVHVARVHAGSHEPTERGREERRPRNGLSSFPRRVEERQRGRVG